MSHKYHYRPPPANHPLLKLPVLLATTASGPLPPSVDLRSTCLPPRNQGQEGCCSGFATAALRESMHCIATGSFLTEYLSPAYLYARTRMLEGTFPNDSGATLADEMHTLQNYGVCPESQLPYNQDASEAPTPISDVAAAPYRLASSPQRIGFPNLITPEAVKYWLATNKTPIAFGMPVYGSFEETGPDGIVSIPAATEKLLGGHAMLCVGYDDATQRVTVRNSWGETWGLGGHCFIPYLMISSWFEAWTASPIT